MNKKYIGVSFEILQELNRSTKDFKTKILSRIEQKNYYNYCYQVEKGLTVEVGDVVVLLGSGKGSRDNSGFSVGVVTELDMEVNKQFIESSWVVSKVDLTATEVRKEKENELRELRNELERAKKEATEKQIYLTLAQNNAHLAELLSKYEQLGGTFN